MEKNNYRPPDPYPEIICPRPCPEDVALIRPLYAGGNSELTAILTYCYQDFIWRKACPEVADSMMAIARTEMHHLELLGEAICALGGTPKYANPNTKCWWNAAAVCYRQDLCKALLHNLKSETDAHGAYLATANRAKTPSLAALLRRIAQDEKTHMALLTGLINCHCRKK